METESHTSFFASKKSWQSIQWQQALAKHSLATWVLLLLDSYHEQGMPSHQYKIFYNIQKGKLYSLDRVIQQQLGTEIPRAQIQWHQSRPSLLLGSCRWGLKMVLKNIPSFLSHSSQDSLRESCTASLSMTLKRLCFSPVHKLQQVQVQPSHYWKATSTFPVSSSNRCMMAAYEMSLTSSCKLRRQP